MKKQPNKPAGRRPLRLRWLWVLLVQAASALLAYGLLSLSIWLGGFVHGLCLWVLSPAAGFVSAFLATRKGLLNYAAWLVPPAAQLFAELLIWGYAPAAGPVFLCGFVALVGAAAGEVLNRQQDR